MSSSTACCTERVCLFGVFSPAQMLSLVASLAIALSIGCGVKSRPVTILVSGDTRGWITPCGCAANQSGGLARRATLARQSSMGGDVILLDAGGAALGTSAYQKLKFESLLRGTNGMGLCAHNIGGAETGFSPDELKQLGVSTGTVWLSANLRDSNDQPFGQSVVQFQRGGLTLAVAGVVDPTLVEHSEWRASEPVQAILKALSGSGADVRIVLAYFDEAGLRALAESLPEVDYIFGGPTGQSISPIRVGTVTIMSATNKGKFMASAKIHRGKNANGFDELNAEIREVTSTLEEDRQQLENLADYYSRLAQHDFSAHEAGLITHVDGGRAGYRVAGSNACTACHQQDDAIWHDSKHAHAWEVLEKKHAHFDPHCQQCHTTGYGQPGGFVNVASSKELIHVGCENCHGPSQAHVKNPTRNKTPFIAKEQCQRCHDHENSPLFALDSYWTKILHRGNVSKTDSQAP